MDILNIKYRTFEQTRHAYASILLAERARQHYISKQMGHANLHTTLTRYAKFIPKNDDGDVLEKVTLKLHESLNDENNGVNNKLKSLKI